MTYTTPATSTESTDTLFRVDHVTLRFGGCHEPERRVAQLAPGRALVGDRPERGREDVAVSTA